MFFFGALNHIRVFEITHGVNSGPSEPKTTTKIDQRQVLASKSAWSHCRCDEEHPESIPVGRWGPGKSAMVTLFGMVGRLRSVMKIDPF